MSLTPIQKRFAMFLGGCIPVRLLFTILAFMLARKKLKILFLKRNNINALNILGYLALAPFIGFLVIWGLGLRKTGPETQGQKIYWNSIRPIHAFMYFMFAIFALSSDMKTKKLSYLFLLLDVILGVVIFSIHHYKNGNFKKILAK